MEWSKPSVMGPGKRGVSLLAGGPVVMVPPGTVLIVLAHHKKVFTLWLRPSSGTPTGVIEEAVGYIKELMESKVPGFEWSGDRALLAVEDLIRKHGRPPGKNGIELSQEHNVRIIGNLSAAMPGEARAGMIKGLEMIIDMEVCPAMVGLLGKGSETGLCGAWPLVLPLAPYFDAVIETEDSK